MSLQTALIGRYYNTNTGFWRIRVSVLAHQTSCRVLEIGADKLLVKAKLEAVNPD